MTTIPLTTLRYYDAKGTYREARFHQKEELDNFKSKLARAGCQLINY